MKKHVNYWACDFETTVWGLDVERKIGKKQDCTEVWSAAFVKIFDEKEEVIILQSIESFLNYFLQSKENNILYFHNLSFDGSFIVDYLLRQQYQFTAKKDKEMRSGEFKTSISKMGQWYWIKVKKGHILIEIRDSLKLIPSSLKRIGKSFGTKHQKLDMEYEGYRYAGCEITEEEREYIRNDVLVLKEALEKMFQEGHNKLTIGSCCLSEFKALYPKKEFDRLFPDLREYPLDESYTGVWNQWEYIHKSYHGGWCYVNPIYAHRVVNEGEVYDVNSLYTSVMHSISGNSYPYGAGSYCTGKPMDSITKDKNKYYFIRVKCRFQLKPGMFPWLHIRGDSKYHSNENLCSSDLYWNGKYYRYYYDEERNIQDTIREYTFTCKDWELFQKTYNIFDLEYLDYIWFWCISGLFDDYIDHYMEIKINKKGFERELAKLFLNNLYGKFAMSDDSSYKEPFLDEEGVVRFQLHEDHNKKVGYIAVGSAITSYAMNFTIEHAIANYERFCYADTDSIHLIGHEKPNKIVEHPTDMCAWKNELSFDIAYYERQKTYVERAIRKDGEQCEPELIIKAAGMSKEAKQLFIEGGYEISDLTIGLELENSNLKAKRIRGGILLQKSPFKLRKVIDKKVKVVV